MKLDGKTRLISFGCSFTSGAELIDHELLGISFDECNKIKQQWSSERKPLYEFEEYVVRTAKISIEEYVNMGSKRSYAAKLADKLGLEHVNCAVPGAAVDHMTLNLFQGHYTQKLNPKTDLIFLGLTTPHRYLTFSPERTGAALSRVMSDSSVHDSDMHYNDYKVMQTYFFAIQNFKNFCIVNNFDFYIQPVAPKQLLFYNESEKKNIFADICAAWQLLPTFEEIFKEILNYSVDQNTSLFAAYNNYLDGNTGFRQLLPSDVCGFKHPSELAHVFFAEVLYDKIITAQN